MDDGGASKSTYYHHVLDDANPDQAPNTGTYPSNTDVLACTSCHADHNYFNSQKGANLRQGHRRGGIQHRLVRLLADARRTASA